MNESEIIKYIESQYARGISVIEIKQNCFARGLTDYDIEKALRDSKVEEVEENKEKEKTEIKKEVEDNSIENWDKP